MANLLSINQKLSDKFKRNAISVDQEPRCLSQQKHEAVKVEVVSRDAMQVSEMICV
jgi:flagellar basal body rod protein FlgC